MSDTTTVDPDHIILQIEPAIQELLRQKDALEAQFQKDREAINQKLRILGHVEQEPKRGRKPKV